MKGNNLENALNNKAANYMLASNRQKQQDMDILGLIYNPMKKQGFLKLLPI